MRRSWSRVVAFPAENRWPFRLHATYEESDRSDSSIYVKKSTGNAPSRWTTLVLRPFRNDIRSQYRASESARRRSVQHRMAFRNQPVLRQSVRYEKRQHVRRLSGGCWKWAYGWSRHGRPPSRGYNPFVSLYWMTTGKTMGGLRLYPGTALLSRRSLLRLSPKAALRCAGGRKTSCD